MDKFDKYKMYKLQMDKFELMDYELEDENWGWFIDIDQKDLLNKDKVKIVNNYVNYGYKIETSNKLYKYIIVFNMVGIITILFTIFSIFKI